MFLPLCTMLSVSYSYGFKVEIFMREALMRINLSDNFELLLRTHKLNIVKKIKSGISPVSNFLHHQLFLSAYPFISSCKTITQKTLFITLCFIFDDTWKLCINIILSVLTLKNFERLSSWKSLQRQLRSQANWLHMNPLPKIIIIYIKKIILQGISLCKCVYLCTGCRCHADSSSVR